MKTIDRRRFLEQANKAGLGLAAGLTILKDPRSVRAAPANDKIVLAAVGAGGRGSNLAAGFAERGDCEFAYVCDRDLPRAEARAKALAAKQGGSRPRPCRTSARCWTTSRSTPWSCATPDHWHALATIWALPGRQGRVRREAAPPTVAGKAARWSRRRGSTSGSSRSARRTAAPPTTWRPGSTSRTGKLGKIHFCRVFNQKDWANFPWPSPTAIRPRGSTGTCGTARPRRPSTTAPSSTAGTTSGATRAATSPTTASTRSTWPAGSWASTIPKSVYCTGGRFDARARPKRPTRRSPSSTSTTC